MASNKIHWIYEYVMENVNSLPPSEYKLPNSIQMSFIVDKNNYKLLEFAAEVMVYFEKHKIIEIAKRILIECALERPRNTQLWIAKNIKRIAVEIYDDCLKGGKCGMVASLNMTPRYLYRVVMFGRHGSGRKTQAQYLIKRFNLILIDAEKLIYQHLRGDDTAPHDPLARELQRAFYYDNCQAKLQALANIISRRLLDCDCLRHGWILINFPHTLQDIQELMERFKIPPNKFVYLRCPEKMCMLRLINMPNMKETLQANCDYYEQKMRFFNNQEPQIESYLMKRQETIIVDASQPTNVVKTEMLSLIEKTPYLMGFKHDLIEK
ncbi:adenylate kinase-like [Musca vetustissima]|uniref:adenylate kinase-like n=1 Tax=Musca vetustissima TaxID=27455 RepID=UPI002AB67D4A|nr:adenylate kinase-like [Musca vetustissima]